MIKRADLPIKLKIPGWCLFGFGDLQKRKLHNNVCIVPSV